MMQISINKNLLRMGSLILALTSGASALAGPCQGNANMSPTLQAKLAARGLCYEGDVRINIDPKTAPCVPASNISPALESTLSKAGYCYIGRSSQTKTTGSDNIATEYYTFAPTDRNSGKNSIAFVRRTKLNGNEVSGTDTMMIGMTDDEQQAFATDIDDKGFQATFDKMLQTFPNGAGTGSQGTGILGSGVSAEDAADFVVKFQEKLQRAQQSAALHRAEIQQYGYALDQSVNEQNQMTLHWRTTGNEILATGLALAFGSGTFSTSMEENRLRSAEAVSQISSFELDTTLQSQILANATSGLLKGDLSPASRAADILFNPLIKNVSTQVQSELRKLFKESLFLPGPAMTPARAESLQIPKEFIYPAMSAANWIQASAAHQGDLLKLPYRQHWLRAAAYHWRAGVWSAQQNDQKATEHFALAKGIAKYFAEEIDSAPISFTPSIAGSFERLSFSANEDLAVISSDRSNGARARNAGLAALSSGETQSNEKDLRKAYWATLKDAIEGAKLREPTSSPLLEIARKLVGHTLPPMVYTARQWENFLDGLDFSLAFMDFSLGLTRVSWVLDLYSAVEGVNFVTGEKLSLEERALSLINVTVEAKKTGEGFSKALDRTTEVLKTAGPSDIDQINKEAHELLTSKIGARLATARDTGIDKGENVFKHFDTTSDIHNAFPENGLYAHAIPRPYAEALKAGLSTNPDLNSEKWITAADDVANVGKSKLAERLSLYADKEGTKLKDVSDYVIMEFRFKNMKDPKLSSPIDPRGLERRFGWIPGGRTKGGSREWLIEAGAFSDGTIDRNSIVIRELED